MDNLEEFNEQTLSNHIISQRSPVTGGTLFYILVHKESDSGFLFNERMLVIQDINFNLFYSKHIKPIGELLCLQKKGVRPIKEQLSLLNTSAELEENTITIRFIKDQVKRYWLFRFRNDKLAIQWFALFKDLQEKSIAKSIKSKTKETASCNISEYASILSHNKYYQQQLEQVQEEPLKDQVLKEEEGFLQ